MQIYLVGRANYANSSWTKMRNALRLAFLTVNVPKNVIFYS